MSLTREQDEFITALYKEMFKKLVNIGYELSEIEWHYKIPQ